MRGLVLFSHGKGLAGPVVMDAIAKATLGRWVVEKDGTVRLTPDDEARTIARRKENAARRARWEATFAAFRREAARLETPDWNGLAKEAARFVDRFTPGGPDGGLDKLSRRGAGDRFRTRLLAALPPEPFLRSMGVGFAFSDRPTRAQLKLPPAAVDAFRLYVAERAAYADAARKVDLPGKLRRKPLPYDGFDAFDTGAVRPTATRLVVRAGPGVYDRKGFALRVRAFDDAGGLVEDTTVSLSEDDARYVGRASVTIEAERKIERAARRKTPLHIPARDEAVWRGILSPNGGTPTLTPEEIDRAARADRNEPLDPLAGRIYAAWSDWRGRPVVGWLTDDLPRETYTNEPLSLGLVDDQNGEGLRVLAPAEPIRALAEQTDRNVLAWALTLATGPEARLEDRARLAYLTEGDEFTTFLGWSTARLRQVRRTNMDYDGNDPKIAALYGALTSAERRMAANGGVPVVRLKGLDAFRRVLYAPETDFGKSLRLEPTVRYPDGLPMTAVVDVHDQEKTVVETAALRVATPEEGVQIFGGRAMTPFEMGAQRRAQEIMAAQAARTGPIGWEDRADYGRLRWGARRTVRLRVLWDGENGLEGTLTEKTWRSKVVPLAELPRELRDEIARGEASVTGPSKSSPSRLVSASGSPFAPFPRSRPPVGGH